MSIRSAAKALIVHEGKVLLNRCAHKDGGIYYDLPGGGQEQYEALEDAVVREVLEETGYTAKVGRFAALAEEIHTNPYIREKHPQYAHRMLHIFLVELTDAPRQTPSGMDYGMEKSEWLPLEKLSGIEMYPPTLPARIDEVLNGSGAVWLGTVYK